MRVWSGRAFCAFGQLPNRSTGRGEWPGAVRRGWPFSSPSSAPGASVLFWDTSALVKAYSTEQGTPAVLSAFDAVRGRGAMLTELVVLEVLTVLAKHWRAKILTKQ